MKIHLRDGIRELATPAIMGILNVTPDSFSDGGTFLNPEDALQHARKMVEAGADIIDIGGESTRPGAQAVSEAEEIDRVLPVIRHLKRELDALVSVDTFKEGVARAAILEGGADMVNDISALRFSPAMAATVAELEVPVVLMHIRGTPTNMQQNPHYEDVVAEIKDHFVERIEFALQAGIRRQKIIIDPGIGFGKSADHNITILQQLASFSELGVPLLIGLSRKSFLGYISGETEPLQREAETLTANVLAAMRGASIIRVHQVEWAVKSMKTLRELLPLKD